MDDLKNKGLNGRVLISLSEDWEVKWWTTSIGVSVKELKEAVGRVGHSAKRVREYLSRK